MPDNPKHGRVIAILKEIESLLKLRRLYEDRRREEEDADWAWMELSRINKGKGL